MAPPDLISSSSEGEEDGSLSPTLLDEMMFTAMTADAEFYQKLNKRFTAKYIRKLKNHCERRRRQRSQQAVDENQVIIIADDEEESSPPTEATSVQVSGQSARASGRYSPVSEPGSPEHTNQLPPCVPDIKDEILMNAITLPAINQPTSSKNLGMSRAPSVSSNTTPHAINQMDDNNLRPQDALDHRAPTRQSGRMEPSPSRERNALDRRAPTRQSGSMAPSPSCERNALDRRAPTRQSSSMAPSPSCERNALDRRAPTRQSGSMAPSPSCERSMSRASVITRNATPEAGNQRQRTIYDNSQQLVNAQPINALDRRTPTRQSGSMAPSPSCEWERGMSRAPVMTRNATPDATNHRPHALDHQPPTGQSGAIEPSVPYYWEPGVPREPVLSKNILPETIGQTDFTARDMLMSNLRAAAIMSGAVTSSRSCTVDANSQTSMGNLQHEMTLWPRGMPRGPVLSKNILPETISQTDFTARDMPILNLRPAGMPRGPVLSKNILPETISQTDFTARDMPILNLRPADIMSGAITSSRNCTVDANSQTSLDLLHEMTLWPRAHISPEQPSMAPMPAAANHLLGIPGYTTQRYERPRRPRPMPYCNPNTEWSQPQYDERSDRTNYNSWAGPDAVQQYPLYVPATAGQHIPHWLDTTSNQRRMENTEHVSHEPYLEPAAVMRVPAPMNQMHYGFDSHISQPTINYYGADAAETSALADSVGTGSATNTRGSKSRGVSVQRGPRGGRRGPRGGSRGPRGSRGRRATDNDPTVSMQIPTTHEDANQAYLARIYRSGLGGQNITAAPLAPPLPANSVSAAYAHYFT